MQVDQDLHLEDLCASLPQPWAVVGNAVAKFKVGHIIDSFPTVIRFNEYVIEGHEEWVGTKTTYRSIVWIAGTPRPVPLISPFIPKIESECPHQRWAFMNKGQVIRPRKKMPWLDFNETSGFALLRILEREKVRTVVFHMDGLRTGHYWDQNHRHWDKHKGSHEWEEIKKMVHVSVYENMFDVI